jgi:hypothetical protein
MAKLEILDAEQTFPEHFVGTDMLSPEDEFPEEFVGDEERELSREAGLGFDRHWMFSRPGRYFSSGEDFPEAFVGRGGKHRGGKRGRLAKLVKMLTPEKIAKLRKKAEGGDEKAARLLRWVEKVEKVKEKKAARVQGDYPEQFVGKAPKKTPMPIDSLKELIKIRARVAAGDEEAKKKLVVIAGRIESLLKRAKAGDAGAREAADVLVRAGIIGTRS